MTRLKLDNRNSKPLRFGSARARPGQTSWGTLRVREGRKSTRLATCVVHGARPGPHVVVLANQHGTEVNGIESIRRFCDEVDPGKLKGTLFAVASANPPAAMRALPAWTEGDPRTKDNYRSKYNMNFNWPGIMSRTPVAIFS